MGSRVGDSGSEADKERERERESEQRESGERGRGRGKEWISVPVLGMWENVFQIDVSKSY